VDDELEEELDPAEAAEPGADDADAVLAEAVAARVEPGERRLAVPDGQVVRRVDRFVADRTGLSRSFVQRLISDGRLVDGDGRQLRANQVVTGGSVVILDVPEPETPFHLEPDPSIPVVAAYEDGDMLIVDKPAGLVVHPAPGHWRGTLVNALLARPGTYGSIAGIARPGIVHRLDRGGQARRRAGVVDGAVEGPTDQEDVPRAGPGIGGRRGRPDRSAGRT
jgi:23S rRNA pseudouridine1911/1915/1917 synthase